MKVLGDIAKVIDCEHRTAPKTDDVSFGFSVGTSAVRHGRIDLARAKPISKETYVSWTRRATPEIGDLIFSREAPMGEVGMVPGDIPVCLGQRTVLMRLDHQQVDHRFLLYSLMSPHSQAWINENSAGSTVPHLNVADVRRIPIHFLPLLDEQRRIVDLLEDHLSHLDAAENYLTSGLRRAKAWHQQLLTNTLWSAAYPRARVGELLREPMRNGRSDRAATGGEGGTRSLTLTAVTRNAFTDANTKVTATAPERARALWLEPGDVFVQRSNTPELVGTTARYDGPREWAIFPDLLIRLRADEDRIDSRFLAAALQSRPGHDQLRRKAKGLAGSMPKIDQSAIAGTTIPLPPVDVQQRLLAIIEDAAGALALLQTELSSGQRRSRILRRALLAAAFSGRVAGTGSDPSQAEEMINA